jgi:glycosyltransferase involved in cell wall biosynthesis
MGLARHLKQRGFEVVVIAPSDAYAAVLIRESFTFEALQMRPHRGTLWSELRVFWQLLRLYRQYRPDLIFHYTIKPNIYGSVVARYLGLPSVAVVTGLGQLLSHRAIWKQYLLERLYWVGCTCSRAVWFLNHEDKDIFLEKKLVSPQKIHVLPSEGIDVTAFSPRPTTPDGPPIFLFAGRLLREKGVELYVDAARIIRAKHPSVRFQMLGFIDPENPDSVTHAQVKNWMSNDWVEYLGESDDVSAYLARCTCVVLPTYYREGIPRVLLEAGGMAKPVIASDSVGCREVVRHGQNGFLCAPKNVSALVAAIEEFLALPVEEHARMGQANRAYVVAQFDERVVIGQYLEALAAYGVG